jgi:hypothetical protein
MRWKNLLMMLVLGPVILPSSLHSQINTGIDQEITDKIIAARNLSESMKGKYTWFTRIDVIREGKVVDLLIQENKYDSDGTIRKKVVNDQEAPLPKSFLIHQIAEEEKTKTVTFLNGLHEFLQKYSLPDEKMVIYFINKSKTGIPDEHGNILFTGQNLLREGDRMEWWIGRENWLTNRSSVSTVYEGDKIEFSAYFIALPDGLNYMSFAEILIPEKSLTIQLHNYDYSKNE